MIPERNEILYPLFALPGTLDRIGKKTEKQLIKSGFQRVLDLLYVFPKNLISYQRFDSLMGVSLPCHVLIKARVSSYHFALKKGWPHKIRLEDGKTSFFVVYFSINREWLKSHFPLDQDVIIMGKAEIYDGYSQITHPDYVFKQDALDYNGISHEKSDIIYPIIGLSLIHI